MRPWPDFSPGVVTFFVGRFRPLRISWVVVGTAANGTGTPLAAPREIRQGLADVPSAVEGFGSRPRYAERMESRPVLALDVDGVISLFGFEEPLEEVPGRFHLIDGMAHCIPEGVGDRLRRLASHYEIIWATGWEDRANDRLPEILGLPGKLPFLTFAGNARFGTAHWKIAAIDSYAGDRPLAWVDDCLDETCETWARERSAPTLLVPTDSDRGLEDAHVGALLDWARSVYTP